MMKILGCFRWEQRTHLEARPMTGTVIGYDPGGNGAHGFAQATIRDGVIREVTTETLATVEKVTEQILDTKTLLGLGIDTLTCWSTGPSGWRPADRWLRRNYDRPKNSVKAPNSLRGSMIVTGIALLASARQAYPELFVTETHPKLLYYAFYREDYDYVGKTALMNRRLGDLLGTEVKPLNDDEWDAAISILPVVRGLNGSWRHDLHTLPTNSDERLVCPCGTTTYVWPE